VPGNTSFLDTTEKRLRSENDAGDAGDAGDVLKLVVEERSRRGRGEEDGGRL